MPCSNPGTKTDKIYCPWQDAIITELYFHLIWIMHE